MSKEADFYDVEYQEIKHETPKAYLVEFPDGQEEWLPKSQCSITTGDELGGYISVPEWLLIDKQIEYL